MQNKHFCHSRLSLYTAFPNRTHVSLWTYLSYWGTLLPWWNAFEILSHWETLYQCFNIFKNYLCVWHNQPIGNYLDKKSLGEWLKTTNLFTLRIKFSSGCKYSSRVDCLTICSDSRFPILRTSRDRNRSLIMPVKIGISSVTILCKLKSLKMQISTWKKRVNNVSQEH